MIEFLTNYLAMICQLNEKFNYSKFAEYINKCSQLLLEYNVKKNDIVSLSLPNNFFAIVLYFAILKVGASVNPMPNTLSVEEVEKNVAFVNPRLLFVDERFNDYKFKNVKNVYKVSYDFSNLRKDIDNKKLMEIDVKLELMILLAIITLLALLVIPNA